MDLQDEELDSLEQQIPILAVAALTAAYEQAVAAGLPVTIVEHDEIIEVSPNGTRRVLKQIAPGIKVTPGTRLKLR